LATAGDLQKQALSFGHCSSAAGCMGINSLLMLEQWQKKHLYPCDSFMTGWQLDSLQRKESRILFYGEGIILANR
jgi:hypothetical protein